ncbi:MAG: hypothetical protein ABF379_05420 [Akkermansiaceae bacterium]
MSKSIGFICAGMISLLFAQAVDEEPLADVENPDGLPEWDAEELEELESGKYIPGSSLIGRIAREVLDSETQEVIELDPVIRELPEEDPMSGELAKVIGAEFLSEYFEGPANTYLIDPQGLLSTQEFLDRERFLNYHARDTAINCYLYIFDGVQELPEGRSLQALMDSHFEVDEPLAVVFYFMGDAGRSQMVFSNKVVEVLKLEEREKVLRLAIEDAYEKSDATSQLDSFSMQLSIGLARLEEIVTKEGGSLLGGETFLMLDETDPLLNEPTLWEKLMLNQGLFYMLLGLAVVIPAALLGFIGRWIANKRRVYVFPIAEGSLLLDAPHAAGVGGVLSFVSATAPPSSQKQDVPDYLQKM